MVKKFVDNKMVTLICSTNNGPWNNNQENTKKIKLIIKKEKIRCIKNLLAFNPFLLFILLKSGWVMSKRLELE